MSQGLRWGLPRERVATAAVWEARGHIETPQLCSKLLALCHWSVLHLASPRPHAAPCRPIPPPPPSWLPDRLCPSPHHHHAQGRRRRGRPGRHGPTDGVGGARPGGGVAAHGAHGLRGGARPGAERCGGAPRVRERERESGCGGNNIRQATVLPHLTDEHAPRVQAKVHLPAYDALPVCTRMLPSVSSVQCKQAYGTRTAARAGDRTWFRPDPRVPHTHVCPPPVCPHPTCTCVQARASCRRRRCCCCPSARGWARWTGTECAGCGGARGRAGGRGRLGSRGSGVAAALSKRYGAVGERVCGVLLACVSGRRGMLSWVLVAP